MKIGVFDSGIGGMSVVRAIETALPEHTVVFKNDSKNVPYGTRDPNEILELIMPIFEKFIEEDCSVIVVACNTVSTTLITKLRKFIDIPLIALEPMIKPAAKLTTSNIIAVCATPTTLASVRYQKLKESYAANISVLEPDCSEWAEMIEHSKVMENRIEKQINRVLNQGADVIVLGCTHYHWIEEEIRELAKDRAVILQPETAIVKRVKSVLGRLT